TRSERKVEPIAVSNVAIAPLLMLDVMRKNMYKEYFEIAKKFLNQKGLNPEFGNRRSISENDIDALDKDTDQPMPKELREFYSELGDGFWFAPDHSDNSTLDGWEGNLLSDYRIHNRGFSSAIEEDTEHELATDPARVERAFLHEQAEKRKRWIPFYGFCGSGDTLCLDSEGRVQFYQALDWAGDSDLCQGFMLAASLTEFVEKWSRYYFISPTGGWTSFCWDRGGVFDWNPKHFPKIK
ncbi:MAG: SMI1/KNR4 family protein, partial [Opitutaceae bacterium]